MEIVKICLDVNLGTDVWKRSFTGMRPLSSSFMPTFSKPRFVVYGLLPTDTSSTSHSSSSRLLESLTPSTVTLIVSLPFVADVTLVFNLNLNPCLVKIRSKFFDTSMSIPWPPT
ncbi:hypothetical protein M514_06695 [Trichuris suis]|uniref:Uncharacterized protein n=1 Tax=Trichuris suis TaxID=68888 RepID=A0A085M5K2_9BILA|nr:hypothetical protein M513_06695 [Trichuris suis]KFD68967.1 hypothetical protein M514_06695 [Trichuris suis]